MGIALAREGYQMTAVELVEHNLEILRNNSNALENIQSFQGDALDLGGFADNEFDITLVFGPLYHLYDGADVHRALDEAIRTDNYKVMQQIFNQYMFLFKRYQ